MKKILYLVLVAVLAAAVPAWGQNNQTYTLGKIPAGWTVKANGNTVTVTDSTAIIPAGATVVLTPPYPAFVKNVTLTDAPAPSCRRITLDTVHHHFVAQDCDTLTGTLNVTNYPVKISIAAGATVTLDGVSINADGNWTSGDYAGITCEGDATIILKDGTTDTVKGFYEEYPGIHVPVGSTLTIQGGTSGTGKLIASSNGYGAGIGGGFNIPCGNIRIEDGIIEATGGFEAAGIGSGFNASSGYITITGGTIEATGDFAAGIGSGYKASCGDITITGGVTRVTATKGTEAPNSIGAGDGGSCGTISFGTQQMYNGTTWNPTPTDGGTYGGLNLAITTTTNTNDTWTLTPASVPVISCRRVDLSQITADSVIQNCDTLTGTLAENVKISIAAGATVTLDGVSINANGTWKNGNFAGITCLGNATLVLKDDTTNTVKGFYENHPGIFVPVNSTLTIQGGTSGTGKLIASSNGDGAGIGGGFNIPCGNIRIEDGIIEATGGNYAAGIGSGNEADCGDITITGGTINATGGNRAAGIGSGNKADCGDITITSGVTSVTATKGEHAPNSIGAGYSGTCGTVTIGDATGAITTSPYTYPAP